VLGLALIWWSLWVPEQWWLRIRSAWKKFLDGELRINPWTLLVFLAFLVVGFYRFYRLNQVPPEMFSDHAEKLIDVSNVLQGQYAIFFPRNTGREAFQMYLTAATARLFGTGISFLSLKLGTCLVSYLSLPFIYLLIRSHPDTLKRDVDEGMLRTRQIIKTIDLRLSQKIDPNQLARALEVQRAIGLEFVKTREAAGCDL